MQISAEGKIGIALGLVGLAGAGAMMVFPQDIEIGWVLIAIAVIGFFGLRSIICAFQRGQGRRAL